MSKSKKVVKEYDVYLENIESIRSKSHSVGTTFLVLREALSKNTRKKIKEEDGFEFMGFLDSYPDEKKFVKDFLKRAKKQNITSMEAPQLQKIATHPQLKIFLDTKESTCNHRVLHAILVAFNKHLKGKKDKRIDMEEDLFYDLSINNLERLFARMKAIIPMGISDAKKLESPDKETDLWRIGMFRDAIQKDYIDWILKLKADKSSEAVVWEFYKGKLNINLILQKLRASTAYDSCKTIKDLKDLPQIEADGSLLTIVFDNIFYNAVDEMMFKIRKEMKQQGEDNFYSYRSIFKKTNYIKIETFAKGSNVIVKISDTGRGIPKKNLAKIFDLDFTTKPKHEGSGTGLPDSKRIIELHNGTIDVESEVGKGTTFTITIPIKHES